MPHHDEERHLPFTPEQLCGLVGDVGRYHEFLPWCVASRITKRSDGHQFEADLVIGYKMFRETFTSRVTVDTPDRVQVDYLKGPFKYLYNDWKFVRQPDNSTIVDFEIDFEFHNQFMNMAISGVFHEAVHRMVSAFEKRAYALYAPVTP